MKIAIAHQNGQVADGNACTEYLIVTVENGQPTGKELAHASGTGSTAMLTFLGMMQVDVLICGALGVSMRNALEMIGILLVPGVTGPAEEAAAKFIVGESRATPVFWRSAAKKTRTTRWHACMTVPSVQAAVRCMCRKRRSKTCRKSKTRFCS